MLTHLKQPPCSFQSAVRLQSGINFCRPGRADLCPFASALTVPSSSFYLKSTEAPLLPPELLLLLPQLFLSSWDSHLKEGDVGGGSVTLWLPH